MSEDRKVIAKIDALGKRALSSHSELVLAVYNKRNQASLASLLAEQLVISIAVAWESFLSQLMLAYVAIDSKQGVQGLQERIRQAVETRFGVEASKMVRFSDPIVLTSARLAALFDPKGWNLTPTSAEGLSNQANQLLAGHHARKFTLENADARFVDFCLAIRNFLSHRSAGSRQALNNGVSDLAGPDVALKGHLGPVGAYLKTKAVPSETRAIFIVNRLIGIANKL